MEKVIGELVPFKNEQTKNYIISLCRKFSNHEQGPQYKDDSSKI
jgi:hypothetical protein